MRVALFTRLRVKGLLVLTSNMSLGFGVRRRESKVYCRGAVHHTPSAPRESQNSTQLQCEKHEDPVFGGLDPWSKLSKLDPPWSRTVYNTLKNTRL